LHEKKTKSQHEKYTGKNPRKITCQPVKQVAHHPAIPSHVLLFLCHKRRREQEAQ